MKLDTEYVRTVIFGVEDSLVSTTGLIAGLAAGTASKSVVIIGGVVAIAVEASSMGASEYISDDAISQAHRGGKRGEALRSGLLMTFAYFLAGLVPLAPVVFVSYPMSLYIAVILALIGIFILGLVKGRVLHTNPLRGAIKILVVGGLTTLFGLVVGLAFRV